MRFSLPHFVLIFAALATPLLPAAQPLGQDLLWQLSDPPVVEGTKPSTVLDLPLEAEADLPPDEWTAKAFDGVLGLARDDTDYLQKLQKKRQAARIVKARLQTDLDPVLLAGAVTEDHPVRFLRQSSTFHAERRAVSKDAVYVRMPSPTERSSRKPKSALSLALGEVETPIFEETRQAEVKTYALTGLSAPASGSLASAPLSSLQVVETGKSWDLQVFNTQPTALFTVDPFGSLGGWYSRDGEMTVSHSGSGGNPGGAMLGSFAAQPFFPIPQTDSFRLDSGSATPTQAANFLGYYRYIGLNPDRVTWVFDFKAEDILPSDLVFRFSDGSNTFFYPFAISSVGAWNRVYVPLSYSAGWIGGNASLFDLARQNVTSIEIQVTRNGTGFQRYLVDNLEVRDFSIPEPDTLAFLVFGAMTLLARRWFTGRRKHGVETELEQP